ncbi:MAG: hypothetical protein QF827_04450 [Alphaproteobacteria bacterium]|nr:hypothetical protein [Alphaproteobacteria bacterium]
MIRFSGVIALLGCALVIGACSQTAERSHQQFKSAGATFRADLGEHSAGLLGRDYTWRMEKELAEIQQRCAEIGIGSAEDAFAHCLAILGGTSDAKPIEAYLKAPDPRKLWFWNDFVDNQWRRYLAYRANFVKKSDDAQEYRNLMGDFLRHQYKLLEEREALGDVAGEAESY